MSRVYKIDNQQDIDKLELCADRKGGGAQAMTYDLRLGLHGDGTLEVSNRLYEQLKGLFRSSPTGGYQGRVPRVLRVDLFNDLAGEDVRYRDDWKRRARELAAELSQGGLL